MKLAIYLNMEYYGERYSNTFVNHAIGYATDDEVHREIPIDRCVRTMELLKRCGIYNKIILAAAVLADSIEVSSMSLDEIRDAFGRWVAKIVGDITENPATPMAERKQRIAERIPNMSFGARVIKIAFEVITCKNLDLYLGDDVDSCDAFCYRDYAKKICDEGIAVGDIPDLLIMEVNNVFN